MASTAALDLDCCCGGEDPWVVAVVSLAGLTVTLEGPAATPLLLWMFTFSPSGFFAEVLLDAACCLLRLLLLSSLRKTPARKPSPEGRCRVARPWKLQRIFSISRFGWRFNKPESGEPAQRDVLLLGNPVELFGALLGPGRSSPMRTLSSPLFFCCCCRHHH